MQNACAHVCLIVIVRMSVCLCVCVCERERERERDQLGVCVSVCTYGCSCKWVLVPLHVDVVLYDILQEVCVTELMCLDC